MCSLSQCAGVRPVLRRIRAALLFVSMREQHAPFEPPVERSVPNRCPPPPTPCSRNWVPIRSPPSAPGCPSPPSGASSRSSTCQRRVSPDPRRRPHPLRRRHAPTNPAVPRLYGPHRPHHLAPRKRAVRGYRLPRKDPGRRSAIRRPRSSYSRATTARPFRQSRRSKIDHPSGISYPQRSTKRPQALSTVARTSAS